MSEQGTSEFSPPEFHGFYVKKHALVILLAVRSIISLTESVVEQLTAEWDLLPEIYKIL